MNLEPVIQCKVSQKDKNKYHILMHIYAIQKNVTDETRGGDIENRLDTIWTGQGGMN